MALLIRIIEGGTEGGAKSNRVHINIYTLVLLQITNTVSRITSSFKHSREEPSYNPVEEKPKPQTQPKKNLRKKSMPPQHGSHTHKGTPHDGLNVVSQTGSMQLLTECKLSEKAKFQKKMLLQKGLSRTKGGVVSEATPTKMAASTVTSTCQSLEFDSGHEAKLPHQLQEPHTEESLFPNLYNAGHRGNAQNRNVIAPVKPNVTSVGYMHYLAEILPSNTDAEYSVDTHNHKYQSFLPPIGHGAHKGGHAHTGGIVTFDTEDLVRQGTAHGKLESLGVKSFSRNDQKNVKKSIFWANKLQKSLKKSGIDSKTVAGERMSRILKKVLVSMENKP